MIRLRFEGGRGLARLLTLLIIPPLAGCGKEGEAIEPTEPRSFDVAATADGVSSLPPGSPFTLVLNAGAGMAIAGGKGSGAAIAVTTADGRTFRSSDQFSTGVESSGDGCRGISARYDSIEVTISGSTLSGTAKGWVMDQSGDSLLSSPFSATLTGIADATRPALKGDALSSPFHGITLSASEPLPTSATAKLVADDGAVIELLPAVAEGAIPFITGFYKRDVLRAGQGYGVSLTGLVDFAGLTDPASPLLRLGGIPAAPTAAEDGFESVQGTVFGGAMVVTAGGGLPAIAGNTSLYVAEKGAPGLDAQMDRSLVVRLPHQPGDTKVRFSYRVIATVAEASAWSARLSFGSEGASPSEPVGSFGDAIVTMEMVTIGGQTAYRGPVTVKEALLPADAKEDVLVAITMSSFSCSFPKGGVGVLIDDLRLE